MSEDHRRILGRARERGFGFVMRGRSVKKEEEEEEEGKSEVMNDTWQ